VVSNASASSTASVGSNGSPVVSVTVTGAGAGATTTAPGAAQALAGQPIVTIAPGSPAATAYANAQVNTTYNTGGATQAVGGSVIPENSPNAAREARRKFKLSSGNGFGVTSTNVTAKLSLEQLANKFVDEIEDASLGTASPAVNFPVPGAAPVPEANLTDVQKARILRDKILSGEYPTLVSVQESESAALALPANADAPATRESESVDVEEAESEPLVLLPGPFVPPELPREPVQPPRFFRKLMF